LFVSTVKYDGLCVYFLYERFDNKTEDDIKDHYMNLEDFILEEIKQHYRPSFLDPGRKPIYVSTTGLSLQEYSIIQCRIKERYHIISSTMFTKKLQKQKDEDITEIESTVLTAKSAQSNVYLRYIEYMFANLDTFFTLNGHHRARGRSDLYQGR
jgi:hypothetical protein